MFAHAPEDYLSLHDASAILPGSPHVNTIWRWAMRGVRGHRLPTVLIGGQRFIAREALSDWIQRINRDSAVSAPDFNAAG